MEPSALEAMVSSILPRTKYLFFDSIDEKSLGGYKFKHDFKFLEDRAALVESLRASGEPREFQLWKRN
ncbi:hypothetical protein D3C86_1748510 [compost metagenome]